MKRSADLFREDDVSACRRMLRSVGPRRILRWWSRIHAISREYESLMLVVADLSGDEITE